MVSWSRSHKIQLHLQLKTPRLQYPVLKTRTSFTCNGKTYLPSTLVLQVFDPRSIEVTIDHPESSQTRRGEPGITAGWVWRG